MYVFFGFFPPQLYFVGRVKHRCGCLDSLVNILHVQVAQKAFPSFLSLCLFVYTYMYMYILMVCTYTCRLVTYMYMYQELLIGLPKVFELKRN